MRFKVDGMERLKKKLWDLNRQANDPDNVAVTGFTQRYALEVHEDLQAHHKEGKEPEYLRRPARRHEETLRNIVIATYKRTKSLSRGVFLAALRLQREAQLIVPIDTSALKASAFTCFEDELDATATTAFIRSEGIRLAELRRRGIKSLKKAMAKKRSSVRKATRQENARAKAKIKREAKRTKRKGKP